MLLPQKFVLGCFLEEGRCCPDLLYLLVLWPKGWFSQEVFFFFYGVLGVLVGHEAEWK